MLTLTAYRSLYVRSLTHAVVYSMDQRLVFHGANATVYQRKTNLLLMIHHVLYNVLSTTGDDNIIQHTALSRNQINRTI